MLIGVELSYTFGGSPNNFSLSSCFLLLFSRYDPCTIRVLSVRHP